MGGVGRDGERPTAPLAAANPPFAAISPRRHGPRRPLLLLALGALALLLASVSGALAMAGALSWPFAPAAVVVAPTPTATAIPTATVTATATATPRPTPSPTAPGYSGPPVTGTIALGCGPGQPVAAPYVVTSGVPIRAVAITFDDGPSPDQTANMLTHP